MTFVHCVGRFAQCLARRRGIVLPTAVSSILLCGPVLAQSQWSGTSPGPIYYNGGNVGIGTSSPGLALDVNGPVRSLSGSIDVRLQAGAAGAARRWRVFNNNPL